MITQESLLKERQELENRREQVKQTYHQLMGAIGLINQLLAKAAPAEETPKE